jgi:hypothetical protein
MWTSNKSTFGKSGAKITLHFITLSGKVEQNYVTFYYTLGKVEQIYIFVFKVNLINFLLHFF